MQSRPQANQPRIGHGFGGGNGNEAFIHLDARMLIERMEKEGFALVLSGGAALGCAHLGVLDYLEARGLVPGEIAGTSMGAIVGAAYACGFSCKEIAERFARFAKVTRWVKFSLRKPALLNTGKLKVVFGDFFGDRRMQDVRIPLKVVATDFETGRVKLFTEEDAMPLAEAVLCSMSIPVLFPPFPAGGRYFVDGFLCANLPVGQVSNRDGLIVAVDVLSERALPPLRPLCSFLGKAKAMMAHYERAFYLLVQNQTRRILEEMDTVKCLRPLLKDFKVYQFDRWAAIRERGFQEASRYFAS